MSIGKSIRIFLSDGSASGIRYAELVNWTGHAIACPRNRLSELSQWSETSKPGIYFLFEGKYSNLNPVAYIGESENVAQRLISHDRNKDFWNEVVIFTSKDENLTKSHIKYLESTIVTLSKSANRFTLENGNLPQESSLPRADKAAMEEFIGNIRLVLGILGYPILEPLISLNANNATRNESNSSLQFKVLNIQASGSQTDEGFVLKAGSTISKTVSESLPKKLVELRQECIEKGNLTLSGEVYQLKIDLLFSSSSYAAAFAAGTSRSGPQSWKNTQGKTLKQIEDEALSNT